MKELFTRRVYTHKGISIIAEIDLVDKTVSLVRKNGKSFSPMDWRFAGRELQYMASWQTILDAMSHAISEATTVLEEAEKRDQDEFLELMIALDKPILKGKK